MSALVERDDVMELALKVLPVDAGLAILEIMPEKVHCTRLLHLICQKLTNLLALLWS